MNEKKKMWKKWIFNNSVTDTLGISLINEMNLT